MPQTPQAIATAAATLLRDPRAYETMANAINPFGDGQASARIVSIVSEFLNP